MANTLYQSAFWTLISLTYKIIDNFELTFIAFFKYVAC